MGKRYEASRPAPTRTVRRPSRPATLESDVIVPLLQSVICATLTALIVLIIAATLQLRKPLLWATGGGVGTAAVIWIILLRAHQDLLWTVERTVGVDLDRDGVTGAPEGPGSDVRAEIPYIETVTHTPDRRHWKLGRIPLNKRDARAVAVALHRGVRFTRRDLVAAGALPDDPEQYGEIYNALLQVGYLRPSGNGAELTLAGREFFEECLEPGW
jgi:hypothetical protein